MNNVTKQQFFLGTVLLMSQMSCIAYPNMVSSICNFVIFICFIVESIKTK